MATASFNGLGLGLAVRMQRKPHPFRVQRNFFAGVSGPQTLRVGAAGRAFHFTGRLSGAGSADLDAALLAFDGLMDGNVYTLVDVFGDAWAATELEHFGPAEDRIRLDPVLGYTLRCEWQFYSHT